MHNFWLEKTIKDRAELKNINFSSPHPFCLEIITPHLLSADSIGKLLYALFNKLNYLFNYLNYQVKISKKSQKIEKNDLRNYFVLICSTPFL